MIETTLQDLRYGFRMLRRSPGFSLLAILCLTLGIGANAAVFSWIEGILLRPYAKVVEQDRLLSLAGTTRGIPGYVDISWPDFLDYAKNCKLIEPIAEKITGSTLSIGDRAERATGSMVSANYFDAIGVHPILGRGFLPGEDTGRNGHPVTVISYWAWQERFKGDPAILGKTQILNGLPYTIVGVAPEGFYGTFIGYAFTFWVPASMQESFDGGIYKLEDRSARWIEGFVRLKPGATAEQAQQEISAVAQRLENDFPASNRGRGIRLAPLWQGTFNNGAALLPTLKIAAVVAILVLLIACANVSNLLLVRSFARRHETTVRLAVGCGRGRLLRQLLTEGLILSTIAAAGGLLVAHWSRTALILIFPPRGTPMYISGDVDWRVVAISAGVCVISTLLFALAPAIQASKIDLASALKSESGGVVGGSRGTWIRSSMVLIQVSLSFVLLVGAGLLIQSLLGILTASPGFSTQGVLTSGFDLFAAGYDLPRAKVFQDDLADRLRNIAGVDSAAFSRNRPFAYTNYSSAAIGVDGYQPALEEQMSVDYNVVSPGYFETVGIPIVSGREFTRSDDETAPLVAVVDETMAARYWRGRDPVGQRLQVKDQWMKIVGVARISKYRNVMEVARPFFYTCLRQSPTVRPTVYLRTRLSVAEMSAALVREARVLDSNIAPFETITMREQVDRSTATQRVAVALVGVFGGLALLLSAIGLYGVMSYVVSQSTRELGLRMALGANASDLLRLVMKHGLKLTAGGLVLGVAVALGSTRLFGYLLYKVSPRDPLALDWHS
jgi:predicted permease